MRDITIKRSYILELHEIVEIDHMSLHSRFKSGRIFTFSIVAHTINKNDTCNIINHDAIA